MYERGSGGPTKIQQLIGEDLFQSAEEVWFHEAYLAHLEFPLEKTVLNALPALKRVGALKHVYIDGTISRTTMRTLREGLPGVRVLSRKLRGA